MTIEENISVEESAVCIANTYGRIIQANKRFCRMFGFDTSEVEGHYMRDLYGGKDWKDSLRKPQLEAKMRSRKGRTFPCHLINSETKSREGIPLLIHSIEKINWAAPKV